ncbi:MAG: amidohydrolase family protein [Rhodospirillales bacterium]|nr:amidohydrolase family protein [Rhodospirillales bacterium]
MSGAEAMTAPRYSVIRGGALLDHRAHRTVATDILIEGDTVRELGPPGLAAPEEAVAVEAAGSMLIPGLVNSHTHGHGCLSKGRGDRWSLELLLNAGPWVNGGRGTEDKYLATLLNAAEMLRRGCTAAYDLTWEFPGPSVEGLSAVARAYADIGMRALVAPMMADTSFYEAVPGLLESLPKALRDAARGLRPGAAGETLATCRRLLRDWPYPRETIGFALAPTIPLLCSEEFLVGCRELAAEHGAAIHTHMAESKIQALAGLERYGQTLTGYFEALGLINERFTAAHGVWLDDDDMRRLADRGASVAANPGSNLRLGSGLPALRAMLDHGINVGIGSDGSTSSDNQNMFEAARLASFVSRVASHDVGRWLATHETFELATAGGARAMGLAEAIGRIAPGYKADIVFLDLKDFAYLPMNDPVNQLIHSDDGSSVHRVMIGGRIVFDDGAFTTIDLEKLIGEVRAAMDRLNDVTRAQKALTQKLEGLVAQYCSCFAGRGYHVARMACGPGEPGAEG